MSVINSVTKTWLKRNGFVCEGTPRTSMRECNGYLERSGRKFRIRGDVVDIGELLLTFDRWANSTEQTISLNEFKREFGRD